MLQFFNPLFEILLVLAVCFFADLLFGEFLFNRFGFFFDTMIKVNNLSMIKLTRLFVPKLQEQGEGYILNMGSFASLIDIPYKAVYSASKAFVYSFSRAVREELKHDNIHVTVICPGPVPTNAAIRENLEKGGFVAKLSSTPPEEVARQAIKGLFKKDQE